MPLIRKERNCAQSTDFRTCLEMNKNNPLYEHTGKDEKNFLCINTTSTSGMKIIDEMVRGSENVCLSENVNNFYRDVIDHPDFQGISSQFEESLGIPLRLSYAIDTNNSIASVQLDLHEYRGANATEDDITINVTPFAKTAPCSKLNAKSILKKASEELARIQLKIASSKGDVASKTRVFDAGRFTAKNFEEGRKNTNTRSFASEQ